MNINRCCDLCKVGLLKCSSAYKNLICAYIFYLRRKCIYLNKSQLRILLKVCQSSSYNDAKSNFEKVTASAYKTYIVLYLFK